MSTIPLIKEFLQVVTTDHVSVLRLFGINNPLDWLRLCSSSRKGELTWAVASLLSVDAVSTVQGATRKQASTSGDMEVGVGQQPSSMTATSAFVLEGTRGALLSSEKWHSRAHKCAFVCFRQHIRRAWRPQQRVVLAAQLCAECLAAIFLNTRFLYNVYTLHLSTILQEIIVNQDTFCHRKELCRKPSQSNELKTKKMRSVQFACVQFYSSFPRVFLTLPWMSLINQHEVYFALFFLATTGGRVIIKLSAKTSNTLFFLHSGRLRYKISKLLCSCKPITPRDRDCLKAWMLWFFPFCSLFLLSPLGNKSRLCLQWNTSDPPRPPPPVPIDLIYNSIFLFLCPLYFLFCSLWLTAWPPLGSASLVTATPSAPSLLTVMRQASAAASLACLGQSATVVHEGSLTSRRAVAHVSVNKGMKRGVCCQRGSL